MEARSEEDDAAKDPTASSRGGRARTGVGKGRFPPLPASSRGGRAGVPRVLGEAAFHQGKGTRRGKARQAAPPLRRRAPVVAGRGPAGRCRCRARELDSPADGGERTHHSHGGGDRPAAWALLAMRALLHACRLVLDVLGIWILVKLDWSRLDACTNS